MVQVSGPLKIMTDKPSRVSEVWVGSPRTRPHGGGLLVEERDKVTPVGGVLSFTSVPGPVLLTLVSGGRVVDSVKGIVPDKASATLAEVVRAVGLADAGTLTALEELALEVAADAARVGTAAQVGVWADQASGAASDAAEAASDASSAASTATTAANSTPGRVTTEINTQLPPKIDQLVPPKVAEVIGSDTIIQDAAAAAVNPLAQGAVNAAADGIRYAKLDSLPTGTNLDDLFRQSESGVHRLVSGRSYPNLPVTSLTTNATLEVVANSTTGVQRFQQVSSSQIWTRTMTNITTNPRGWSTWKRIDGGPQSDLIDVSFQRRDTLAAEVDLNSLTTRFENGIRVLGSHSNYENLPAGWAPGVGGSIVTLSTGVGDTWQRVWQRFGGKVWERQENSSGSFTEWVEVKYTADNSAPAPGGPQTTWEATGIVTSLEEGESFAQWLAGRQPLVSVSEIGQSNQGRPITSITIGDPSHPALFIMCAQHGDEIAGRESALIWARTISEMRPDFLDQICVVIVPAINVDKLNIRRLTATGTDLNRGWQSRNTSEVQALWSAIQAYDTLAVIDAHEGGNWADAQLASASAPEIDPTVRGAADALMDAAWAALEDASQPVSMFPGSDNLTNSRNAIPHELGIPCLLVETPNQLAGSGWNGPGVDPRIYAPELSMRVEMYRVIFDGVAEYIAGTVSR